MDRGKENRKTRWLFFLKEVAVDERTMDSVVFR